jgi:hypothetical protein
MNFRTKAAVVEAMQLDGRSTELIAWLAAGGANYRMFADSYDPRKDVIILETRAGQVRAEPGDWILRDAAGAFYHLKPDAFDAMYAPVPEAEDNDSAARDGAPHVSS